MRKRGNKSAAALAGDGNKAAPMEDVWTQSDKAEAGSGPCLGIDLGTTNSCVGLWLPHKNRVKIIRNPLGVKTTPSVVSFAHSPPTVGQSVCDNAHAQPESTVACAKRVIGRRFDSAEVQGLLAHLPFKPIADRDGGVQIPVCCASANVASVSPEQVATAVLSNLKAYSTEYARKKGMVAADGQIECAVVGVPAHFTQIQREATIAAAKAAGFVHVKTLSESTAAAMAYGLFVAGRKKAVVVDLGGGTLDVTVICIDEGNFKVQATGGCVTLGGEDFDTQLLLHVLKRSPKRMSGLFTPGSAAQKALRRECCRAKIELSEELEVDVVLQDPAINITVTRADFEKEVAGLVQRCTAAVQETLREGGVTIASVDECVLVGGGTRVPRVREALQQLFRDGGSSLELCLSVNADEAIAEGTAVQGAILSGVSEGVLKGVMMMDALPWSVGLEEADGAFQPILLKNERIPCHATKVFKVDAKQKTLLVQVFEGNEEVARDNQWVAEFKFTLPPYEGEPDDEGTRTVPVTFEMPEVGKLKVTIFNDSKDSDSDDDILRSAKCGSCAWRHWV